VRWDKGASVRVTTLDALIARYGAPAFCKIDVEGGEFDVLRGLSYPLKALSFEYIPATVDVALACVERLSELGRYEYNWAPSEPRCLWSSVWLSPVQMANLLRRVPVGGGPATCTPVGSIERPAFSISQSVARVASRGAFI
jgi:hypothetical protein